MIDPQELGITISIFQTYLKPANMLISVVFPAPDDNINKKVLILMY